MKSSNLKTPARRSLFLQSLSLDRVPDTSKITQKVLPSDTGQADKHSPRFGGMSLDLLFYLAGNTAAWRIVSCQEERPPTAFSQTGPFSS